ncbi:MAG: rRNA pseudouridine synthase [Patescibacteria group bacterium]|nr:rRNA pseudouridine synthase [Patescibacteria group bacterium]
MERLSKYLAKSGVASRRKAEELILAGRVMVNGIVQDKLGIKVDPERDKVTVDEKEIRKSKLIYYLLNKPKGYTSTVSDIHVKRTVLGLVPKGERLYPVGRLDKNTKGLIILTNDGDLAQKLTHPSFEKEKEYLVKVEKEIKDSKLKRLEEGIKLEDGITRPAKIKKLKTTTYSITIKEGRKRQVRRMFEKIGHPVKDLERIRIDSLIINDLKEGGYRPLKMEEIEKLKND